MKQGVWHETELSRYRWEGSVFSCFERSINRKILIIIGYEVKYIMFRDDRRKKLRNRVILAALGVFIMTFGIWLNYQGQGEEPPAEDTVQQVDAEKPADEDKKKESTKADEKQDAKENAKQDSQQDNDAGSGTEPEVDAYLIKEVNGVVKVFICDESGKETLYLITSIPFDLLSERDQQLFVDGVRLETEEDLGKFLENFDS